MKVRDVSGQFQLNEPLIIQGLDVGRNVTSIRDYDISDIKSVERVGSGTTTFAANIAQTRQKKLFPEAAEFTISHTDGVTFLLEFLILEILLKLTISSDIQVQTIAQVFQSLIE